MSYVDANNVSTSYVEATVEATDKLMCLMLKQLMSLTNESYVENNVEATLSL